MSKTTVVVLPAANVMNRGGKISAFMSNPDLIAVTIFSMVGLLATILFAVYLPHRFPDLGISIEQYNQF
jgi:hypothetical protein